MRGVGQTLVKPWPHGMVVKVLLAKSPVCEASMAWLAGSRCVSSSACCAAWVVCAACCCHPRWKVAGLLSSASKGVAVKAGPKDA